MWNFRFALGSTLLCLLSVFLVDPVAEQAADVGIRRGRHRLVGVDLLVDVDVAQADVAAPVVAAEVRLHVSRGILLVHFHSPP
jgi:hypothetical protein